MNQTPRGNRLHIAIFGRRNVGKSSLINALTEQDIAVISDVAGTTTDPVYKSMEILPIGPVLLIDTPGIDDEGDIGRLRIERTKKVLEKTDVALIVTDRSTGIGAFEQDLIRMIREKELPVIIVYNKSDVDETLIINGIQELKESDLPIVTVSAKTNEGIALLKEALIKQAPKEDNVSLMGGLVNKGDLVILVTPIDSAAPKGRMILPQVQVIRDILDQDATMMVCKETELEEVLGRLKSPPNLVVTDSQAFAYVADVLPKDVLLTSFSILFARFKGDLPTLIEGAKAIQQLSPGDEVLIVEGCTHHRQEDDIGTVKIPRWLEKEAGDKLNFTWCSGTAFEEELEKYKLIVHCGSCMHNRREMMSRIRRAKYHNVPMVNYGVLIGHVSGILDRVIEPFPEINENN